MKDPEISIVIPCYNAQGDIQQCLEAVYGSNFKSFEAVIVDDGSSDKTIEICSKFKCRIVRNDRNRGPSYSRNSGAEHCNGRIILFIDSDILINENTLGMIHTFFEEHPDVHIVQGRYSDEPYYKDVISKYKNYRLAFRELARAGEKVAFVNTSIVAMRRRVLKKYKFDENVRRAEDSLFGWRYHKDGNDIILDKKLQVIHKKRYSMRSFLKYQFKSGADLLHNWVYKDLHKAVLSRKNPLSNRLQLLRAPLSMLFFLILFIALICPHKHFIFPLLLLLVLTTALQSDFLIYVRRVDGFSMVLSSIFIYLIDGFVSGLGVIYGLARIIFK